MLKGGICNDFITLFACNNGSAFIHVGGGFLMIIFHYSSVCNSGGVHICFGREGFLMILSSVVSVEKHFILYCICNEDDIVYNGSKL
jgi:hypothetical protein